MNWNSRGLAPDSITQHLPLDSAGGSRPMLIFHSGHRLRLYTCARVLAMLSSNNNFQWHNRHQWLLSGIRLWDMVQTVNSTHVLRKAGGGEMCRWDALALPVSATYSLAVGSTADLPSPAWHPYNVMLNWQHIQSESKNPPAVFWYFFLNGCEYLINFYTPIIRSFVH